MTPEVVREQVMAALLAIAPEANLATLSADRPLRDQLDIDSFDFLRLLVSLHERLGIDIPEADYAQLATLDALVAYLAARRPG